MKLGDRFKVGYICDCHKHNYDEGIINWINPFKYYPNRNIDEYVIKNQIEINFVDGTSIMVTQ